jgi:hypothetical protein
MSQILIRPIVTEKMTAQGEKEGRYGFVVAKTSNKVQIKRRGGKGVQRDGDGRAHHDRARQATARATPRATSCKGPHSSLEEGHRHPGGRRVIDFYSKHLTR